MATMMIIRSIPLIISTTFKHFTRGPPQPSWSLKLHLLVNLYRDQVFNKRNTIEEMQSGSLSLNYEEDPYIKIDKIFISHEYRIKAQVYIEKLVKPYEIVIDSIWKCPRNDGINGEIVMNKNWNFNDQENYWEKEKIVLYLHGGAYAAGNLDYCREMICGISKASGARVLSVEYRLAPQQPFPAGLCDALATYLYLTNPPDDSGFKPYKSNQIVICGDSAGGGLSISLGLAIRDLGLPPPAGIVGWSPWLDLTHSMPSFIDPIMNETDLVPATSGNILVNKPSIAFNEFKTSTRIILRNIQQRPDIKLIGDDSLKRIGQPINFYIVNEGFAIPYVSPMLAESLGGLPPMLIITGNVERLRDEAIYFSYRATNPEKYRLPACEIDFDNSRFKSPTKVTLEVYDEMSHVFQLFKFSEQSKLSIQRTGNFISNAIQEAVLTDPPPHSFNALKISCHGKVQDLDESSIEHVLKWDKVGVFPDALM